MSGPGPHSRERLLYSVVHASSSWPPNPTERRDTVLAGAAGGREDESMDEVLNVELPAMHQLGSAFTLRSDEVRESTSSVPCIALDGSETTAACMLAEEIIRKLSARIAGRLQSFAETAKAAGVEYQTTEDGTVSAFAALGFQE